MVNWLRRKWSLMVSNGSFFQGRYFYRLIWLGIISVCIPIIIAGTVYYQTSVNNAYQQTEYESRVTLAIVMERVERILSRIEWESMQLALNPEISDSVSDSQFDESYILQRNVLDTLSSKRNASDLIEEIILYHNHSDILLTLQYGHVHIDNNYYTFKKDIDYILESMSQAQWLYLPEAQKNGYVSFVRRLPMISNNGFDGLIVLHVDINMLQSHLDDSFITVPDKSFLILDSDESIIFHSREQDITAESWNNDQNIGRIMEENRQSDVFFARDTEGQENLYSYQKTTSGRTYISLIPEEHISQQLNWIRWVTVWSVLTLITVGLLLVVFNSVRMYNPIQQLITHGNRLSSGRLQKKNTQNEIAFIKECLTYLNQESKTLSTHLRKMEPNLRERFFHKLLVNGYIERKALLKDCTDLNIPIEGHYMVLVVEVESVYKEQGFLTGDEAIVGFAITNVMEELLEENRGLNGYVLNFNEGNGIAVISGNDMPKLVSESEKYGHSICDSLQQYLNFKVTIGLGRVYTHIADIVVSYQEALVALRYKVIRDTTPLLSIEELESLEKKTISYYPHKEEESIIKALKEGDIKTAEQALISYSRTVRQSNSYMFIFQSYHMLLSAIIQSINQRGGSTFDVLENNLFDQLKGRKSTSEICNWFIDVCFPLYKQFTDQEQMDKGRADIMRICAYIHENIQSDISLIHCSDLIGTSPSHVSRLFKKVMGVTFVEYVVNCKVEEAKRLLIETEYSIKKIAMIIGYSERNLSRVFQRYTHLTPGQFRAHHR